LRRRPARHGPTQQGGGQRRLLSTSLLSAAARLRQRATRSITRLPSGAPNTWL